MENLQAFAVFSPRWRQIIQGIVPHPWRLLTLMHQLTNSGKFVANSVFKIASRYSSELSRSLLSVTTDYTHQGSTHALLFETF